MYFFTTVVGLFGQDFVSAAGEEGLPRAGARDFRPGIEPQTVFGPLGVGSFPRNRLSSRGAAVYSESFWPGLETELLGEGGACVLAHAHESAMASVGFGTGLPGPTTARRWRLAVSAEEEGWLAGASSVWGPM